MALNVSVVLRANADQLEGELGEAMAALRGLGTEAKSTGGAMSTGLAQGTGVLDRLRGLAGRAAAAFQVPRNALGQLALQATDVAQGLASRQSPLMILMQQGGQIAQIFGPGAIVGVGVVLAAGAAQFIKFEEDAGSAISRLAEQIEGSIKSINSSLGSGIPIVEKLVKSYQALDPRLQGLELQAQAREAKQLAGELGELDRQVLRLLDNLERAGGPETPRALITGALGNQAVRAAVGRCRAGEITDLGLIAELEAAGDASAAVRDLTASLIEASEAAGRGAVSFEALAAARAQIGALADGAEADLGGRLINQLRGVQGEVDATTGAFERMYEDVVGGSYVPDMVLD